MKNKLEYAVFLFFSVICRIIGLQASRKFSSLLAFLFYHFIPIRKQTVLENLRKAFPEKNSDEIKKIAYDTYKSFSISLVEILLMPYIQPEKLLSEVRSTPETKNLILDKYAQNRGVIMLSAHFGNWEYIAAGTGLLINESIYVIVKSQRNPYVNEWMNKARTRWRNKVVPLGISVREIYKQLKQQHIVAMIADQRGPSDGIRVNFFGQRTAVYPGPAMLSLKTNSPILFGISVRQKDFTYKTYFEEVCTDNLPEKDEDKIIEISQRHTDILEKYIRLHPEQWLWMHKRWKY